MNVILFIVFIQVPVLLSKTIELFVTELTLRSWLLTEDGKRRTVQVIMYYTHSDSLKKYGHLLNQDSLNGVHSNGTECHCSTIENTVEPL